MSNNEETKKPIDISTIAQCPDELVNNTLKQNETNHL